MNPFVFLQRRSRTFSSRLHSLTFCRSMGGGPRTFPGGLNKWQWKRLHEKKAREKENRLLEHEKQLYQARIRSQIRTKLASDSGEQPDPKPATHGPLSPQDHIKALADRFMKEGAEDLWNEADGPVKAAPPQPQRRVIDNPIDLKKLISEHSSSGDGHSIGSSSVLSNFSKSRRFSSCSARSTPEFYGNNETGSSGNLHCWLSPRNFSVRTYCSRRSGLSLFSNYDDGVSFVSNNSSEVRPYSVDTRTKPGDIKFKFGRNESCPENDSFNLKRSSLRANGDRSRWPRFRSNSTDSSDDEDDEEDDKEMGSKGSSRWMTSSAALGKYDTKTKKRVPLKFVEDEDDLSQHVEAIRREITQRSLEEFGVDKNEEETILSSKRFDECNISTLTVKALAEAGFVQMTTVQEAALSICLEGNDVLVKARTGTGKTAAFLLPAIETALKASSKVENQRVLPIHVLILCPTRELASQIAAEANVLLKYHNGIGVQTLVGGTRFKVDQKLLESDPCQIIVATPGRLLDHVENKSGFSARLMRLKLLILDEADHLLDLGFRKDLEKIVDCLPRQRQSILFSATIPKEIRRISQLVLKREHTYVDTVGLGLETHAKVKQFCLVAPHEQHFQIVHDLLKRHIAEVVDYKVIVFCTTAMVTSLMFSLLREMQMNVREMHSRKPQLYRTRISDEFKESKRLILITSDVSARGMNYPDVTLVVQVGIPTDREQYIHRLGRTGREGKEGEGVLLIAPWEEYFLEKIKDLPIEKCPLPKLDRNINRQMEESMAKIDTSIKEAACHAWLGYYNSIREIGRDKTTLVQLANQFCESVGLQKPPALFRKTALKMGLKDIPGIRIRK